MSRMRNILLCCLFVFSANSCVSWKNIRNCYKHVQIGKTTAWAVKKECGRPNSIIRKVDNTIIYSYSQENYDMNLLVVPEIIDFYFSPSGMILRTRMYNSNDPLPWTCSDPFGDACFDEVPIVK